jgi:thiol-disulfide isomerase/thioredoxin
MQFTLFGLSRAWRAEWLKLKGSGMLLMVLILGTVYPLLYTIGTLFASSFNLGEAQDRLPFNYFKEEFDNSVPGFGFFFFPLALIVIIARLAGVEHKTDTWKMIETLPVSRLSIWVVKWLVGACLAAIIILVYVVATLAFSGGMLLVEDQHEAAQYSLPLGHLLLVSLRLWVASLAVVTLQLAFSVVVKNTIWPIVIGIAALIITNIAGSSNQTVGTLWPYALTGYTSRYPEGSEVGAWLLPSEWQGLIWLLLAPMGFLLYRYREAFQASFSDIKLWALTLGSVALLAAASWWVQQPAKLKKIGDDTIIAGKIEAEKLPDSIEVLTMPLQFELMKIPVQQDGAFYAHVPLIGEAEELLLRAGYSFSTSIFAGKGDSVYIKWSQGKKPGLQSVKVLGTAIATNQFLRNGNNETWSRLRYYLENPDRLPEPTTFYKELMDEWEEKREAPGKMRTADGFGLSDNLRILQEKLITVDYITMAVFDYPRLKNIKLEDSTYAAVRQLIQPLLKAIQPFDSTLVGWSKYHQFLNKWMVKDLPKELDKDSAYLSLLLAKPAGKVRDQLLFDFLDNQLRLSRDSAARGGIMQLASNLQDPRFYNALAANNALLNRLRKGQQAPPFVAHRADNQKVSLSDLRGKYVVIDVWATWCGPCRIQSPIFEKMAEKYKEQPITFLALSVDESLPAWQRHQQMNKSKVVQWRADGMQELSRLYGVDAIPRFLLIDPQGRFVNANMPMPSDANFEVLLRQALGLPAEEG